MKTAPDGIFRALFDALHHASIEARGRLSFFRRSEAYRAAELRLSSGAIQTNTQRKIPNVPRPVASASRGRRTALP